MKTTKKIAWTFMFAIFLIACEKEDKESTQTPGEKKVFANCTPSQNITGIVAAINTIEALSNCQIMDCSDEIVYTSVVNHYILLDMNTNSSYTIYSNTPVTPAEQSSIIASAKNWANNNAPAGYFVNYIDYIPAYIVGPSAAGISLKVTYRKCGGIAPPPSE